jgi:hypothetical protein
MTRPEDALDRARSAAQPAPAPGDVARSFERDLGGDSPSDDVLHEWAVISVDPELVYSSRRGGAPLTFMKRVLLRLMRQYTAELEAQQTRFNLGVLGRLRELERRRGE